MTSAYAVWQSASDENVDARLDRWPCRPRAGGGTDIAAAGEAALLLLTSPSAGGISISIPSSRSDTGRSSTGNSSSSIARRRLTSGSPAAAAEELPSAEGGAVVDLRMDLLSNDEAVFEMADGPVDCAGVALGADTLDCAAAGPHTPSMRARPAGLVLRLSGTAPSDDRRFDKGR